MDVSRRPGGCWEILPRPAGLGGKTFQGSRLPYGLMLSFKLLILVVSWVGCAVGLAVPDAHAWFKAWIPAFFHVVLAAFVLVVSFYHPRAPTADEEEP